MTQTPSRPIRSYVLRQGRLTPAQARALETLMPKYGIGDLPIDIRGLFKRAGPVYLEIGFGNGDALLQAARDNPHISFLGVEVHGPGVGRLLLNLEKYDIANVRVAQKDVLDVLNNGLPDASLDRVLALFPDPWQKKRHHKRRLINPPLLEALQFKLSNGGLLQIATDWHDYAEHVTKVLTAHPAFQVISPREDAQKFRRPMTKYERRGLRQGHRIHEFLAIKLSGEMTNSRRADQDIIRP